MNKQVKTLSLSEIFLNLNEGGSIEEIQNRIREVTSAVLSTGNQGKVTIQLTFARNGGEGSKQLQVKDQISAVLPKLPKPTTLFFATEDGSLTRQNPDQAYLIGSEA